MFGRDKEKPIDLNRILASAVDAFLDVDQDHANGNGESKSEKRQDQGIGPVGSVAIGVALAAGARAAYSRIKRFDVQEVAEKVEQRLAG